MTFLALNYKIPANPSRYRVAVWKALRELGAVYLQDGVAAVPQQDGMEQALRELRERILDCGGQAALLQITFCDEADEQALLQAFAEARSEEYAELRDDAQRLKVQLEWERSRGADADEERCALELRRLKRRLESAIGRDFRQAAGREEAEQAVQALLDELPGALDAVRRPGRPVGKAVPKAPARSAAKKPSKAKPKAGQRVRPKPAAPQPAAAPAQPEEPREEERRDMPVFLF